MNPTKNGKKTPRDMGRRTDREEKNKKRERRGKKEGVKNE